MTHTSVAPMPLEVGATLTFAGDPNPWTVQAVTEHFAAATRLVSDHDQQQAEYHRDPDDRFWEKPYEDGDVLYTVLDWRNGVRGPCNLVGQAYGAGAYTPAECAQMLAEFEAGELAVSHRNRVRIEFGEAVTVR